MSWLLLPPGHIPSPEWMRSFLEAVRQLLPALSSRQTFRILAGLAALRYEAAAWQPLVFLVLHI